jgi:putative Holliday junction resolvase
MRYMALDIGEKRIGIATSDPQGRVASPLCVLDAHIVADNSREWTRLVEEWEPDALVIGQPLGLSGEPTAQTSRVQQIGDAVATRANLPHYFVDERLSSKQAKRALRDMGYDEKRMRGKIDMLAASIFLQSWLDEQNAAESTADGASVPAQITTNDIESTD